MTRRGIVMCGAGVQALLNTCFNEAAPIDMMSAVYKETNQ